MNFGVQDTLVAYDDVRVLRRSDPGLWCRIDGVELFVARLVPRPGTTVRMAGDRGRLVVPEWFALDHGLLRHD
jgi:hypothetical protein